MQLFNRYWGGVLVVLVLTTAGLYAPGLTGSWHFDDAPSLANLVTVTDSGSTVSFVVNGRAGPLGRPVSLLSFAWQAQAWPDHPEQFLLVNIIIHLINVGLVFLLFKQLTKPLEQSQFITLFASAAWAVCPLLASSSLFIIQRMTTLSALFVLIGLVLYAYLRGLTESRNRSVLLAVVIAIFTGLSAFSKENGLLLPVYILVLEIFWFSLHKELYPALTESGRWIRIFLMSFALILFGYIVFYVISTPNLSETREFSIAERFNTELVILWDYLRQAFFPRLNQLGPFHDDYMIHDGLPVLLSGGLWAIVIAVSVFLRKYSPILGLAVFWFLAAHALESSVFLLELYFEHRNYVALIGPFFSVWVFLFRKQELYKLVIAISITYLAFQSFLLYQTTSLWGNPNVGAIVWAKGHPNSERAVQYLANQYLLNQKYENARLLLQAAAERNPKSIGLTLQSFLMNCSFLSDSELQQQQQKIATQLQVSKYTVSVPSILNEIQTQVVEGHCQLTLDQLLVFSDQLLKNTAYTADRVMLHALHQQRAAIYQQQQLLNPTMLELEAAFAAWPRVETVKMAVDILLSAGLPKEALAWIDRAIQQAPIVQRADWLRQLAELRAIGLQQLESSEKLVQ